MVINNHNGYIVKKNDFKDIAIKIEMLIKDRKLLHEYGKKSLERYKEKFTFEIFEKNYMAILEDAII